MALTPTDIASVANALASSDRHPATLPFSIAITAGILGASLMVWGDEGATWVPAVLVGSVPLLIGLLLKALYQHPKVSAYRSEMINRRLKAKVDLYENFERAANSVLLLYKTRLLPKKLAESAIDEIYTIAFGHRATLKDLTGIKPPE